MKKIKYLIPVFVLTACVSNKEVYDDVYTKVEKPAPEIINEDLGYADYIKNSESEYNVEIDSSARNNNGLYDSYYTNTGDINVYNYDPQLGGGFNPYYNNDMFYWNTWNNWNYGNTWVYNNYYYNYY